MSEIQRLMGSAIRFWFRGEQVLENYRPNWLEGLEIDLFLPSLNVGFEVDGAQHRLFVPKFQETVDQFRSQQERDRRKNSLCKAHGVKMIHIRSFKGIYAIMRRFFPEMAFPVLPEELRLEIKNYRRSVHISKKKWISFKVKGNKLIGTNKASALYLKKNEKETRKNP